MGIKRQERNVEIDIVHTRKYSLSLRICGGNFSHSAVDGTSQRVRKFRNTGVFTLQTNMAVYSVSIHCQLGTKVLFDRVCSVSVHMSLLDLYNSNIEDLGEVDKVKLKYVEVAETKSGRGSQIETTEVIATLKDLGLRYIN